jgi:hypothetical protein
MNVVPDFDSGLMNTQPGPGVGVGADADADADASASTGSAADFADLEGA